jgi:hypothetical protein
MKSTWGGLVALTLGAGGCSWTEHNPSSLAGAPSSLSHLGTASLDARLLEEREAYCSTRLNEEEAPVEKVTAAYAIWQKEILSIQEKQNSLSPSVAHLARHFGTDLVIYIEDQNKPVLKIELMNRDASDARAVSSFLVRVFERIETPDLHLRTIASRFSDEYGKFNFFVAAPDKAGEFRLTYNSVRYLGFPGFIPSESSQQEMIIEPNGKIPEVRHRFFDLYEGIKELTQIPLVGPILTGTRTIDYTTKRWFNSPTYPLEYRRTEALDPGASPAEQCYQLFAEQQQDFPSIISIKMVSQPEPRAYIATANIPHKKPFEQESILATFHADPLNPQRLTFTMKDTKPVEFPFIGDPVKARDKVRGRP